MNFGKISGAIFASIVLVLSAILLFQPGWNNPFALVGQLYTIFVATPAALITGVLGLIFDERKRLSLLFTFASIGLVLLICLSSLGKGKAQNKEQPPVRREHISTQTQEEVESEVPVEQYYQRAMEEFVRGSSIGGLNLLNRITDEYSKSIQGVFVRGNAALIKDNLLIACEHDFDDIAQAVLFYDTVLFPLKPNHFTALVNRGVCYTCYANSRVYSPRYQTAVLTILERKKYAQMALADFDKAIKLRPDSFAAHYGRAVILEEIAGLSEPPTEAIAEYEKAMELAPKNELWTDHKPGIYDEAEVFVGQKPLCIISPTVKRHMSTYFDQITTEPVVLLTTTIGYVPSENDFQAFTHFQIARINSLFTVKNYDQAKKHLNKAIELNPKVPMFYKDQYQLLELLKDTAGAFTAKSKYDQTRRELKARMKE